MHNDPWSGARVPDSGDACDLWDYFRNAVGDLSPLSEPYFTTTAARDTALSNWVAAGNTTRDGLRCFVQGIGAQRYTSGVWVSAATSGNLSISTGWAAAPGYHGPTWALSSTGWATLSGAVQRTGTSLTLTTTTLVQFATLPTQLVPSAAISPISWALLGFTPNDGKFPVMVGCPAGSSALSVVGMATGTGTVTQNFGIVNLEGVSWKVVG